MKLKTKLKLLQKESQALLTTNYYNLETCKGILLAAKELNHAIILQLTKSSIDYMGLSTAVLLGRTISEELNVDSWIHLDHCKDIELIKKCLDVGFDSVMIDASDKIFEENIKITSTIVELAKSYDINVEAELGNIPGLGFEINRSKYTDPYEAKLFSDIDGNRFKENFPKTN